MEEQQAEEEEELENYDGDLAPPDDYAAASTWDGLERVGHLNKWWNKPSTAEDKYTPYGSLPYSSSPLDGARFRQCGSY